VRRFLTYVPFTGYFIEGVKRNYAFQFGDYAALCENEYARYAENPAVTGYFFVQKDFRRPGYLEVNEFSFSELHSAVEKKRELSLEDKKIKIPKLGPIFDLHAAYDLADSDIVLYGKNDKGEWFSGRPLCQVDFQPVIGVSQTYDYYSMKPIKNFSSTQKKIEKFSNTSDAQVLRTKKEGNTKKSKSLKIVNQDILFRSEIKVRTPAQKEVMGYRAVEEYLESSKKYKNIFSQDLHDILYQSGNVIHLSTLRARMDKGELVSEQVRNAAYANRLLRTEWLHRHAFVLHPKKIDPQKKENLAAARACDNTRMMLLERVLKWFGLKDEKSKNSICGEFDLLLDTEIIEKITLIASCMLQGCQFQLRQEIDTLVKNPEIISASDLAGLIALLSFMVQSHKPQKKHIVKIEPGFVNSSFFRAVYDGVSSPSCDELPQFSS